MNEIRPSPRPGYIQVRRDYSRSNTFTLHADRYCTYCGSKGVYGDKRYDEYDHRELYCFRCDACQPRELNNVDYTLPALLRMDAQVIDFKEDLRWEDVSEKNYALDLEIARALKDLNVSLAADLFREQTRLLIEELGKPVIDLAAWMPEHDK